MRRKRIFFLAISSFGVWAVVTYLFMCPNCYKDDESNLKYTDQVNLLENEIESIVKTNSELYRDLKGHMKQMRANFLVDKIRLFNADGNSDAELIAKSKQIYGESNEIVKSDDGKKQVVETSTEAKPTPSSINTTRDSITRLQTIPKLALSDGRPVIAVLVFSCDRVTVRRSLDRLLRYRPSKEQFPIIVSQDCSHRQTTQVILSYGDELFWIKQPDQSDIQVPPKEKKFKGYFKIARHYGWALNYVFNTLGFATVIIVEDDLDVSQDFFEYFLGTYWLLRADPTLWCVSAWNDNGNEGLVDDSQPQLLYRTDFFPGLGWMLTSKLWEELSDKWPKSYWDDWIRKPEQRKDRACIRPEVSRTKTFGKIGVSNGLFYEKHLKYIKLNEQFVTFTQMNLTYLLKDSYDSSFVKQVYESPLITYQELKSASLKHIGPVRVTYKNKEEYKRITKQLGLMDDFRSGVPRTAYRGVVTFWQKSRRVFIAPQQPWKGYNVTWS